MTTQSFSTFARSNWNLSSWGLVMVTTNILRVLVAPAVFHQWVQPIQRTADLLFIGVVCYKVSTRLFGWARTRWLARR